MSDECLKFRIEFPTIKCFNCNRGEAEFKAGESWLAVVPALDIGLCTKCEDHDYKLEDEIEMKAIKRTVH